jgi:hypothetical protein
MIYNLTLFSVTFRDPTLYGTLTGMISYHGLDFVSMGVLTGNNNNIIITHSSILSKIMHF